MASAPITRFSFPLEGVKAPDPVVEIEIELQDEGGGIGRVEWRLNGVTVQVPLPVAEHLTTGQIQWMVPGLREELCRTLLRALPRAIRKQLMPIEPNRSVPISSGRDQPSSRICRSWFVRSASRVHTAADSRYTLTAPRPNCRDRPRATRGAKAAPISQARSAVKAAPM